MDAILRLVNAVRWRLNLNVLAGRLALGVLIGSGAWVLLVAVARLLVHDFSDALTVAVAGGIAVGVSLVGAYLAGVGRLQAAVAYDEAAGLKERISTALVVGELSRRGPGLNGDPFALAVVDDAERAARGARVGAYVPYRAPGMWPWSLACLAAAGVFHLFMPQIDLFADSKPKQEESRRAAVVESQAVKIQVNEQFARVREMAADNKRLADLTQKLEALEVKDTPDATPDDIRREAVKRIDSVKDQLEREASSPEMSAMRELQRQLSRLEPKQGDDAASKLSESLANGDMKSAREALERMQKELEEAAAKGDEASKQKMEEMAKRLEELAKQLEKLAQDKSQMAKELENKAGLTKEQAEKLLEQLSKMDAQQMQKALQEALQQSPQNQGMNQQQMQQLAQQLAQQLQQKQMSQQQCKNLAQAMAQCAQCMQAGDGQGGMNKGDGQGMQAALQQLSELEMSEQLMNEMQAAMAELKKLRDGVCDGMGLGKNPGERIGNQGPNEGLGYGSRIGREKAAHKYDAEKARVRLTNGEIIGQMLIDGPQIKGEAAAEVRDALNAAVRDAQDAVQRQNVPAQYSPAVQSYFEALAGLLNLPGSAAPPPKDKPAADDGSGSDAAPR